jgi:hypothetical protein
MSLQIVDEALPATSRALAIRKRQPRFSTKPMCASTTWPALVTERASADNADTLSDGGDCVQNDPRLSFATACGTTSCERCG